MVAQGGSTTCSGTMQSAVLSTIPSPLVTDVSGDVQSPRFDPLKINSSGGALQQPLLGWNDACAPSTISLVDISTRRPTCGATSSLAHSVVRGTSTGNGYQKATEDRIDQCITWITDDHPVNIVKESKWPRVLKDFTKNPHVPHWYDQLVASITQQYDLATNLQAVDSCWASTTSTPGDRQVSRFALIASSVDESSWDNCLMFPDFEGHLMVTLITIHGWAWWMTLTMQSNISRPTPTTWNAD